jgi:hypothetical protein
LQHACQCTLSTFAVPWWKWSHNQDFSLPIRAAWKWYSPRRLAQRDFERSIIWYWTIQISVTPN